MRQGQGWAIVSSAGVFRHRLGPRYRPAANGRRVDAARHEASASGRLPCSCSLARTSRPTFASSPVRSRALKNMINELTKRAAALRGKSGAAVMAERRAIDEAQVDWLAKNLTGNQLIRLRQIELQWEGASAMLSRPTVADYLKLTPEQRQTLVRMISERNAQRSAGRPARGPAGIQPEGPGRPLRVPEGALGEPARNARAASPSSSGLPGPGTTQTQQAGHSSAPAVTRRDATLRSPRVVFDSLVPPGSSRSRLVELAPAEAEIAERAPLPSASGSA